MRIIPNHVTTIITASPQVIDALTRHYTDEEKAEKRQRNATTAANYKERTGNDWPYAESDAAELEERIVDFGMVVPPPAEGYDTGGCSHSHPFGYSESDPDRNCWYSWNRQFWGTKWNGYDSSWEAIEGDRCRLQFDTAWTHPAPIVDALSRKFPDEVLEVQYADEDLGSNCGTYKVKNGELIDLNQPEYGPESLELAAQIKYGKTYAELKEEWGE